jgi:hypothetical protein
MRVFSYLRTLTAFLAVSLAPTTAHAVCGLQTVNGGAQTIVYDPFSPTGVSFNTAQLQMKRINDIGGNRTQTINFYFYSDVPGYSGIQLNATTITPVGQGNGSIGGGSGTNVFSNSNLFPASGANPQSGVAYWDFAGNAPNNDKFNLNLTVVLPSTLDLTAGGNIPFNIRYSCQYGTGNGQTTLETGTFPAALTLNVKVLSALQASYVGTALDFGDVTNVTTASLPSATYQKFGNIRVASSGAFEIKAHSQNNFRLVSSGGNANTPAQSLRYTATLVGQARIGVSGNSPILSDISKVCSRAGIGGQLLPLTASLTEGPQGASPAKVTSVYSDILTITVTPQVDTVAGTAC